MDVRLSDEQLLLQQSARDWLARECPSSRVREAMDDPRRVTDALWKSMADLGWTGLVTPEEYGGVGLGWLDLCALMEELGRALCPAPFFSSAVVAAEAIRHLGDSAQRARWLPELASGRRRAALAHLEDPPSWAPADVRLRAVREGDGHRLRGAKRFVSDAVLADWLVVSARADDEPALFVVDAGAPGVEVRRHAFLDETRSIAEVELDLHLPGDARLCGAADAASALEGVLDRARVALAAEAVGGAERVLEWSVAYAGDRVQFGRPIGSFQAIQHRCADMLVRVECARSAAWYAAWAVQEGEPDARTAALLAKATCTEIFRAVAADGIQIHGGLGFTWEQDLHLYYKRALADAQALGSPDWCREQVARLELDGPAS